MHTDDFCAGGPWAHPGPDSDLLSMVCELFAAQAKADLAQADAGALDAYLALAHAIACMPAVTGAGRLSKLRVVWAVQDVLTSRLSSDGERLQAILPLARRLHAA